MKVYTCNDHVGYCPCVVASVIIADDEKQAMALLVDALSKSYLFEFVEPTLVEIDITQAQAILLLDEDS